MMVINNDYNIRYQKKVILLQLQGFQKVRASKVWLRGTDLRVALEVTGKDMQKESLDLLDLPAPREFSKAQEWPEEWELTKSLLKT